MPATKLPPGPRGNFLFGNLGDFRRDLLGFFLRTARAFGDVASFRIGLTRIFLVSHPDLIEQVLVHQARRFRKHYIMRLLRPTLGNGLLLSDGDSWLRQRRLVQPAFHRDRINAYGNLMTAFATRMVDGWQDGEVRDLHADMMRVTLEIVAKALFDADVADKARNVGEALEVGMEVFIRRWRRLFPLPTWIPTPTNLRLRWTTNRLNEIVYGFIKERRASGKDSGDLLSMLLNAQDEDGGGRMTDQEVRDEAMTLFLAGHETTANALAWTWYLLAQHPEVEAKLLAELDEVLGSRPPTVADLPRLKYTEHVITESMRLYPPVYTFGREAVAPCELGGYSIPAGQTILMSPWVVHRDPRYFADPERFDPDRWDDGLARRLPHFAYFPFSGGPRICIGNNFALMEMILILATVVPRFHFTLVPEHPVVPQPTVTLRPAHGIKALVTKRAPAEKQPSATPEPAEEKAP